MRSFFERVFNFLSQWLHLRHGLTPVRTLQLDVLSFEELIKLAYKRLHFLSAAKMMILPGSLGYDFLSSALKGNGDLENLLRSDKKKVDNDGCFLLAFDAAGNVTSVLRVYGKKVVEGEIQKVINVFPDGRYRIYDK